MLLCIFCQKECKNDNSKRNHERLCSLNPNRDQSFFETNKEQVKNLKKENKVTNQYTKAKTLGIEMPVMSEKTRLKISEASTKNNLSRDESVKQRISASMKLAHKEGRAWNIGKCRWNNKPSWPEQFFMQVIENEFEDKNYVREYPVGLYSLDFSWPHKKLCIEIDGDQHERFIEYKKRDIKKDDFLITNGWKILRIKWRDMFSDTKKYIKIAKEFIEQ